MRKTGNKHVLTVPKEIADLVPAGQEFVVEINDDGILYRAVEPELSLPLVLPAWLDPGHTD
jgi:hypothetical protein